MVSEVRLVEIVENAVRSHAEGMAMTLVPDDLSARDRELIAGELERRGIAFKVDTLDWLST